MHFCIEAHNTATHSGLVSEVWKRQVLRKMVMSRMVMFIEGAPMQKIQITVVGLA